MIELSVILRKLLELVNGYFPFIVGWLSARTKAKVDRLTEENKKLKEWNTIDEKPVNNNDVYDSSKWV